MNGASASGPNTEEGREGSNGAAGEMDAPERRDSELGGTLNPCGLVLWSAAAVSVPRGIWRLKNGLGERGEGGRRGRARAQDQTAKIKPSTRSQGSPSEWVPQSTKRSGSAFKAQPTKECAAVARFFPARQLRSALSPVLCRQVGRYTTTWIKDAGPINLPTCRVAAMQAGHACRERPS